MALNVVNFPGARAPITPRRLVPERLREARTAKQYNQTELAELVGVSRQAISAYEQGEKLPDPETLLKIAQILDQRISFFTTEDLPEFGPMGTHFFRKHGADTKRRNVMSAVLGKWFVNTTRYFDSFINYPPISLPEVPQPASADGRYTDEEIEVAAEECRKLWGMGVGPISNVLSLLESKGIAICRVEFVDEQIEAFSFYNGSRPFIFLASEKESAARARFDAAHELGHLILHKGIAEEDLEDKEVLKAVEREANRFAGAFLLPRQSFPSEVYTTRLDAFLDLKRRWKVAIQAMIYRCKDLGIFDEYQVTNLYKQISAKKWRTKEPLDDLNILPLEQPKLLNKAVNIILENGRISADEITTSLPINTNLLEKMCNLPKDFLVKNNHVEFTPTLK